MARINCFGAINKRKFFWIIALDWRSILSMISYVVQQIFEFRYLPLGEVLDTTLEVNFSYTHCIEQNMSTNRHNCDYTLCRLNHVQSSNLCVLSLLYFVFLENLLVKISFLYHAPMRITLANNQQKFGLYIL